MVSLIHKKVVHTNLWYISEVPMAWLFIPDFDVISRAAFVRFDVEVNECEFDILGLRRVDEPNECNAIWVGPGISWACYNARFIRQSDSALLVCCKIIRINNQYESRKRMMKTNHSKYKTAQ